MEEKNKLYQLAFHLPPLLDHSQIEKIIQKINNLIIENNGLILDKEELSIDKLNKKELAYPIKKYTESFYLSFDFLINGQNIEKINNQFILEKDIMRHIIIAKEKPKQISKEIIDYKASKQIKPLKKSKEKEKIKIEELDQKLEEILNN